MTPEQAVAFVKAEGIVVESARATVPSLAEAIAREPIRGSWWAHPKAKDIFVCSRAIRTSGDVLVCRLLGGKEPTSIDGCGRPWSAWQRGSTLTDLRLSRKFIPRQANTRSARR